MTENIENQEQSGTDESLEDRVRRLENEIERLREDFKRAAKDRAEIRQELHGESSSTTTSGPLDRYDESVVETARNADTNTFSRKGLMDLYRSAGIRREETLKRRTKNIIKYGPFTQVRGGVRLEGVDADG